MAVPGGHRHRVGRRRPRTFLVRGDPPPLIATATIATPMLWAVTIGLVVALLVLDFLVTRRPHDVSLREALG